MKKTVCFLALICSVLVSFSQEISIYTTNGNSYTLNKQENTFVLSLTYGPNSNVLNLVKNKVDHIYSSCEILNDRFLKIESLTGEIDSALRYINGLADYSYSHLLLANNDILKWTYNRLFVKVKENVSIESLLQTNNVSYVNYQQFSPDQNVYLIYLTTGEDKSISVSNQLYETGYVVFAQPDFWTMSDFVMSSDLFPYQWNLNNTGQLDTFVGIDIDAVRAWNLATGTNVNVAVVDEGVDLVHQDLVSNLNTTIGYDATGAGSNGGCSNNDAHGTACAGIIAAENNNDGVTGIAYDSKIVPVRIACSGTNGLIITSDSIIAKGIDSAIVHADIINNSWDLAAYYNTQIIRAALNRACVSARNGRGCVVVFASGNKDVPSCAYTDPLFDSIIFVGAISPCGVRKSSNSCDMDNSWGSSYGRSLSVVAPGVAIPTTDIHGHDGYNDNYANAPYLYNTGELVGQEYNYTSRFSGTSAAAAHVSGVAALILSIKPNLTAAEVKRIIEKSARKIRTDRYPYTPDAIHPNGSWNDEMGYGLVDAYAAVRATAGYDLYTRDNEYDNLNEPNTGVARMLLSSPDIWVRKFRDTVTRNQSITIEGTNYVYVRVHNNGPYPSLAHNDSVVIYANADSAAMMHLGSWPLGGWFRLGAGEIPEIPVGRDTIVCVKVDFPHRGSGVDFAICSIIKTESDPLAFPMTANTAANIINNNNVSLINVKVLDHYVADDRSANFSVFKMFNNPIPEEIRFRLSNNPSDSTILDFADVTIELSDALQSSWQDYMDIDALKHIKNNEYLLTDVNVTLPQITSALDDESNITVKYNFLTKKVTKRDFFTTFVLQYKNEVDNPDVLVGSFAIQVEKPVRAATNLFTANAGNDTAILIGTNAALHATQINEDATYRWYDKQRNFKYEGLNYTVTPSETSEYILEVTAESDGYRDLDTVKVNVVPGCIRSITPNPVSDNWVTVSYEYATTVTSAHLYIYNTGTTTLAGSYDLSNLGNVSSLDVEVTNYPTGSYTAVLVCDNAVCHSKVLIRQ